MREEEENIAEKQPENNEMRKISVKRKVEEEKVN